MLAAEYDSIAAHLHLFVLNSCASLMSKFFKKRVSFCVS